MPKMFLLRNGTWCILETCAIVISTPENLLVKDFWSSRSERKPLFKLDLELGVEVCKAPVLGWLWRTYAGLHCAMLIYLVKWYLMHLCSINEGWGRGSICQSIVLCQCWWTSIQGISALVPGGSICQSIFACHVLSTGSQGIYALVPGGSICQSLFVCQVKAYMLYNLYESFYSHCFCCCCSVCYCCPCVIIYTKQQQHEIIRRTRTTTKT